MSPSLNVPVCRLRPGISMLGLVAFWLLAELSPAIATEKTVAAETNKTEAHKGGHPLTLAEAIDLAFAQNPDLTAATARIGEAETRVAQVAAGFYPKLMAKVGYDYTNNPALAFSYIVAQRRFSLDPNNPSNAINNPGWVENLRPEVIGSINLYRGGQDSYLKMAAELGVQSAELEHSAIRNTLAAAVTSAYYAAVSAPKQLEVARRSSDTVNKELQLTRSRVSEGTSLRGDALSLEVRTSAAGQSELKAKNAITLSRSALKTLLGNSAGELPEPRETDLPTPILKESFNTFFERALSQRPELEAAGHQLKMRQHELDAAEGALLPRVNAYASYGGNSATLSPADVKGNGSVGINAEMDLFAGGAINATISAAERRVVEAQAVEQKMRLEVENEVRQAYTSLQQSLEQIQVASKGATAAEEALRLVREQYHGGTATVTRYLEAETDRADASLRSILAHFEAQVAEAQLQKAIGHWR